MTERGPRWLSVAVPLYCPNRRLLRAMVAELAKATPHLLEVILSHDEPSRGLPADEILQEFTPLQDQGVPVTYLSNSPRLGMVGNWNRAVLRARGEYVVNLGQDDILPSAVIDQIASQVARRPEAAFFATGRQLIDEDGRMLRTPRRVHDRSFIFDDGLVYDLDFHTAVDLVLRNGQVLGEPCCIFMSQEGLREAGGYSAAYSHAADLELLLRLLRQGDAVMYPALKSYRRIHKGNATVGHVREGIAGSDRWQMFEHYVGYSEADRIDDYRAYLLSHDAVDALRQCRHGHPLKGARVLLRSCSRGGGVPVVALGRLLVSLATHVNPDRRRAWEIRSLEPRTATT